MVQIVLARLDDAQKIVKLGRVDLGELHTFETIKVPVSAMWLNDGDDNDIAKAEKFAGTEDYTVFLYEGEANPLERARQDILIKHHEEGQGNDS